MATTELALPNLSEDRLWQVLQEEVSALLTELSEDPKHQVRVTRIRVLLAHPQCLQVEQIFFAPHMLTWASFVLKTRKCA